MKLAGMTLASRPTSLILSEGSIDPWLQRGKKQLDSVSCLWHQETGAQMVVFLTMDSHCYFWRKDKFQ